MSLKELLMGDLQRQYYYEGNPDRRVTVLGILFKAASPRFAPIVLFRLAHWLGNSYLKPLAKVLSLMSFVIFGIEIGLKCEIGSGLYLPHTVGTVIGAARVGRNVTILQGVTIGAKELDLIYDPARRPSIGDNVMIGAGAKILGGVSIGNNVTVGANAVVTKSLPDNVVAVGVPAQIIRVIEVSADV